METTRESQTIDLGNGRWVKHPVKLRSTLMARFRECNPFFLDFCKSLISSADSDGVNVTMKIQQGAIDGFPSAEVENICRFLAEVTRDIGGFPEHYDWAAMSTDQRVDFFDLEFSEKERIAYSVTLFFKLFAQ